MGETEGKSRIKSKEAKERIGKKKGAYMEREKRREKKNYKEREREGKKGERKTRTIILTFTISSLHPVNKKLSCKFCIVTHYKQLGKVHSYLLVIFLWPFYFC